MWVLLVQSRKDLRTIHCAAITVLQAHHYFLHEQGDLLENS